MRLFDVSSLRGEEGGEVELWLRNGGNVERRVDKFEPSFYVLSNEMDSLERGLEIRPRVAEVERVERRPWPGRPRREMLEVSVREFESLWKLATRIYEESDFGFGDARLFNVDLSIPFRYLLEEKLYPLIEIGDDGEERWSLDYNVPDLKEVEVNINPDNPIDGGIEVEKAVIGDDVIRGEESEILLGLKERIQDLDPDIIYTTRSKVLSTLFRRARDLSLEEFHLGRLPGITERDERTIHSYGSVVYKPKSISLRGRIHIDKGSSFLYKNCGLEGIVELSRLSGRPLQEVAQISPGTVISSMQIRKALDEDVVIPWKKRIPEDFKTMEKLVKADRGAFIFQPRAGFHRDVIEVDFSSLFPNIIVEKNISPETVNCGCCNNDSVPQLKYSICKKKRGFLPRLLEPIIERREEIKEKIREKEEGNGSGDGSEMDWLRSLRKRSSALKWILVTCFGYMGYKNAKFGKVECHEAICAFARKILTRSSRIAEKHGFNVLHGITDSLFLGGKGNNSNFLDEVEEEFGIPLDVDERYRWIVFLPRRGSRTGALNRYYGVKEDGEIKARGIEMRRSDSPEIVKRCQREMIGALSEAESRSEFMEKISDARNVLHRYIEELMNDEFSEEELCIESKPSKDIEAYSQLNRNACALLRYSDLGIEKGAGEKLRYVVSDSGASNRNKVSVLEEERNRVDKEYYKKELERSMQSLLMFLEKKRLGSETLFSSEYQDSSTHL